MPPISMGECVEPKTAVQQLVDEMLDHAWQVDPGAEIDITLSNMTSLLLPLHGRDLHRFVAGRAGSYRGPVYRDCMVWDMRGQPDELVIVSSGPPAGDATPERYYYGDLSDGTFSTSMPQRFYIQ